MQLSAVLLLATPALLLLPEKAEGFVRLWPALVALVIVFLTHAAPLALLVASGAGVILLVSDSAVLATWFRNGLPGTLTGPWHVGALVFTLLLGAFAALLERGGGLLPLLRGEGTPSPAARKRFLGSVYGLGLLCFFDGLANSLMLGRVARPLADRLQVPRAFLAYLVDTTSSAVACVAFISTWIAVQLSLIAEGIKGLPIDLPAYALFLQAIPHNFYCLFALLLAFLSLRRDWRIGPMARRSATTAEESVLGTASERASVGRAVVPLAVLLLSIPLLFYFLHRGEAVPPRFPVTLDKIQQALGSNAGPPAFVLGSGLALLVAVLLYPPARRREVPGVAARGAAQLVPALVVLVLAWILGSVLSALGTADWLANALGDRLPLRLFPAGVFILGCLVSFVSGTSWGTMGLLMPLVLPAAGRLAEMQELPPETLVLVVPGVIAAVFGGAVFGDHCSPYSDTTIVSALACGVSTAEHTVTQLPYAVLTAAVAIGCGYLPVAAGLGPWVGLLLGAGVLGLLVAFVPSRAR